LVHRDDPDWSTAARDTTDIRVVSTLRERDLGELTLHHGTVDVTNQVVSYLRRRHLTGQVLDETPLDLPARQLRTRAVWYTLSDAAIGRPASLRRRARRGARGLSTPRSACSRFSPPAIGGTSGGLHGAAPRHRPDDGLRL
jgi:DEAD/DEAH box helicase domain-containing protein